MGDDTDHHKAALEATKRGVIVAVWSLVVAVLGLGYSIFADFNGPEWFRGAVSEWIEEERGEAEAEAGGDPTSETATEQISTNSDAESDGSQNDAVGSFEASVWQPVSSFVSDWLVKPGLPFWTGFWRLGLIGVGFAVVLGAFKALLSKGFGVNDDGRLFLWWMVETVGLAVLMVTAALAIGEEFWQTALLVVAGALLHTAFWGLVGLIVTIVLAPVQESGTGIQTRE